MLTKTSSVLLVCAAAAALVGFGPDRRQTSSSLTAQDKGAGTAFVWETDIGKATERAAKSNKPMLFVFR